ncbi:MAG: hypothetical protein ACRD0Q_10195 [Acidimicrobiales bacterium]
MTGRFDQELSAHLQSLGRELDEALHRTVELHRCGADEEAVLAETSLAFRSARALEALTGVAWEEQIKAKVERVLGPGTAPAGSDPTPTKRRWRRAQAPAPPS